MNPWVQRALAVAGVLAGVLVLLVLYGSLIEPRLLLDVERLEVSLPDLDEDRAATVAMFSDLQVGMWFDNTGMVERIVDEVVEARPDVVLLGGDFLYSETPDVDVQIDTVMELLAPLTDTGIPMIAVLGNHDHATGGANELTAALEDRGVEVLQNEAVGISTPGDDGDDDDALHVVGIGPARPGLADVDQALQQLAADAPRIVLMHNPTSFPELPTGSAPLALAGHTHCGQIALPGTPSWSYLGLTQEEAVVADGFATEGYGAADNRLFVNCGIGFSRYPIRINAPPQVVFVELLPGS